MKKLTWIDIGDAKECPDCKALGGRTEPEDYWNRTGRPRERNNICGDSCRCMLAEEITDEKKLNEERDRLIDQAVDEYMNKSIVVDTKEGGYNTMLLKDFEQIKGMTTLPYSKIAELEELIYQYKAKGAVLPREYYSLADVQKQINWLKGNT